MVGKELLRKCHKCVVDRQLLHNFQLPTLDCRLPNREEGGKQCSAEEFHTWLGALACGVDISGEVPNYYVSTYQTPEPHTMCQYGTRARWTGMVHSDWVCDLLSRVR